MEVSIFLNVTDISNITTQINFNKEYIFNGINCSIYLICSIFSVIMNIPLIINWIFNCKKNIYADFLIISIVVSDFIEGVFVCPIYLIQKLIEMNLISSNLISINLSFITECIDNSIYLIIFSSLIFLSLHRLKQLISPFKEGFKLNRFRILILVSIWFIFPIISFPIIWLKTFLKYKELIEFLQYISTFIIIIFLCIVNIQIIFRFRSKLKKSRLNKKKIMNEKKAIFCTLSLTMLVLINVGSLFNVRTI